MNPRVLLLFDIDGTLLLGASEAHRDAIYEGLRETFGVADPGAVRVPAAGRTDSEIARAILRQSGLDGTFDAAAERFRAACDAAYRRLCPATLTTHVAPGVLELLDGLEEAEVSLVTGNYEPIARRKLAAAGLGHHFSAGQGGFGSDAENRALLPAIARRRAAFDGGPHPRERTIVIGDTPRDIACARADGVRVFAIASGPYPAEALDQADAVFPDAWALRTRLEAEL
ncbi:MAG: phosphoglycolate phosphatase [Solirubrobacteraceae bacterium]|jgi:phosphoglycolate phosphatase-like HAD superfamily hydrolase|nr:phosphoglycolate phosphatase [Solirubrobacteraceae bacterium]